MFAGVAMFLGLCQTVVDSAFSVTGTLRAPALVVTNTVTVGALTATTVTASNGYAGIQSGAAVTAADSTVTQAFTTAFSAVPVVICTFSNNYSPSNMVKTITTSNFQFNCGAGAKVFYWIAIGAP